jgi:4-amino-4-deoxy-L-arabinose transferase-like glycosyltransferase
MSRGAWVLAALSVLLLIVRLPVLTEVPERDITTYAVIGQGLLHGRDLYSDLWDHKPPGVHVAYAASIALVGENTKAIYLLSVVGSVLGLFGVWAAARRYDASIAAAVWAGALWLGISGAFRLQGEMPNTELLANGFLALGFAAVLKIQGDTASRYTGIAAGLLFTAASLFKHLLVLIPAALLVVAVVMAGKRWRATARQGLTWCAVGALTWASVFGWFAIRGGWQDFYEALFVYNRAYAGSVGANLLGALSPARLFPAEFRFAAPILLVTALAAGLDRAHRRSWIMLGTYLLAAAAVVALHPGPYSHYRILLLPPMCIGFGWAATSLRTAIHRPQWLATGAAVLVLLGAAVPELLVLRVPGAQWSRERFGNKYQASAQLGALLDSELPPGCAIYELGAESQLYFYSRRDPPSGVFYAMPLEGGPLATKLQRRVIADLTRHNVCLLIVNHGFVIRGPLMSFLNSRFATTVDSVPLGPGSWLEVLRPLASSSGPGDAAEP